MGNTKLKIILLLIITLVVIQNSIGLSSEALKAIFENANEHYKNAEFHKATEEYISIIEAGYENKDVYYNLGNSYFKLGKLGYAILCYEKAQKLAPRDADIQHNLVFAQTQIVDRIELPEEDLLYKSYNFMISYLAINEITIVLLITFYIEITLLILLLFLKKKKLMKNLCLIFGIILVLNIIVFAVQYKAYNRDGGVVLVEKLDVLTEPGSSSQIAFTIHEGTKLYIVERRDDWYRVNLENRLFGWVRLPEENKENILGTI